MIFSLEHAWMWGILFSLSIAYILFYTWYKAPTVCLGASVEKSFGTIMLSIFGFVLVVSFVFLFAFAADTYLAPLWMPR